MIIIELTYKKTMAEVDQHLEAHRDFLTANYKQGVFIASGPKIPREGGIILANITRESAQELIKSDPFYRHAVAEYKIIEFNPVRHSDTFKAVINSTITLTHNNPDISKNHS